MTSTLRASLRALGHPAARTRATLCRARVSNGYTHFRCSDIQPRAIRVTARSASWPVGHRNMRQASVMSRDRAETFRTSENQTRSYFRACDGVCWAGCFWSPSRKINISCPAPLLGGTNQNGKTQISEILDFLNFSNFLHFVRFQVSDVCSQAVILSWLRAQTQKSDVHAIVLCIQCVLPQLTLCLS